MQACDRCHARKTRCDRRIPRCGACEKARVPCLQVDKLRQRNVSRGYVDSVETQLQILAEENLRLQRELAKTQTQTQATSSDGSPSSTTNAERNKSSQTPTPGSENTVAAEVGYLSLKATGETRYLGSSSGIGLAGIIANMIDTQPPISDLQEHDDLQSGLQVTFDGSIPPRQTAMAFIHAYFQHTHLTFPLLHKTTFLQTVDKIYSDPEFYAIHMYDAFVFDMVLSIGSSNFNRFGDASAGASVHYARAQAKLSAVLSLPGLIPLRAILLLSHHGIFSNLKDTSASIWHLIGIGVRLCYEMGLHLEPRRHSSLPKPNSNVDWEEEMKRRCFWCLYNLDRVVSFTLGRPAAIKDEDIDVPLPSSLDDDAFGPDHPISGDHLNEGQISPFLHVIRIRQLSGQILSTLYAAKQPETLSYDEKRRVRHRFHEAVIAWKEDTRLLNVSSVDDNGGTLVSSFRSQEWYTAVFNNALLLLYRPSPYFPHPVTSATQPGEERELLQLFSAAKASINAYADLHRQRRLNYSWITLHGVFIAGLAYVYCIGRALKDHHQIMPIPDYLEIINDTRACSNVLVAICERWNVVRRSCELFNRLSNAVIRDVVNNSARRQMNFSASAQNVRFSRMQDAPWPSAGTQMDASVGAGGDNNSPHSGTFPAGNASHLSPIYVANEFRNQINSFEGMFPGDTSYQSELIMGFAQEWPFDDLFTNTSDDILPSVQQQPGLW